MEGFRRYPGGKDQCLDNLEQEMEKLRVTSSFRFENDC